MAIAAQQQGGLVDVSQWSNAFVVDGGDYSIAHVGTGRIYSSCQDEETVRGEIKNGPEARFLADMPPFSSRAFAHRAIIQRPPIEVQVLDWQTAFDQIPSTITIRDVKKAARIEPDRVLSRFALRKGANFPTDAIEVYVLYGRKLHRLKDAGDQLELSSDMGAMSAILQVDRFNEFGFEYDPWSPPPPTTLRMRRPMGMWPRELTIDETFDMLVFPLLTRSLGLADQEQVDQYSHPSDRARLLIYVPMSREFFVTDPRFISQRGNVLYSLDVFEPES